jgi:hypothetical protein
MPTRDRLFRIRFVARANRANTLRDSSGRRIGQRMRPALQTEGLYLKDRPFGNALAGESTLPAYAGRLDAAVAT